MHVSPRMDLDSITPTPRPRGPPNSRKVMPNPPTLPAEISVNGAPIPITHKHLRLCASWIRDDLDPAIAREGPEILHPDDVLSLHELFLRLAADAKGIPLPIHPISGPGGAASGLGDEVNAGTLRYSRLHLACLEIRGKATRWPGRLADECDILIEIWREKFGSLDALRPFLFGMGGRLTGIAGTGNSTRAGLLKLWSLSCPDKLQPARSKRHGHLEFTPGAWWINGMFACHAGCIDIDTTEGGICFDQYGAYSLVLKDDREVEGSSPQNFTYRCQPQDRGRFRLTSADHRSRYPIRVLRSHSLNSLWAPKVGVRYDGLFRVSGWSLKPCKPQDNNGASLLFEVSFRREENQVPMEEVLRHPLADEVDDYMEYKRLRHQRRDKSPEAAKQAVNEALIDMPGKKAIARSSPRKPLNLPAVSFEMKPPGEERGDQRQASESFFKPVKEATTPRQRSFEPEEPKPKPKTKVKVKLPDFTLSLASPTSSPQVKANLKNSPRTNAVPGGPESSSRSSSDIAKANLSVEAAQDEVSKPNRIRGSIFSPPSSRLNVKRASTRKTSIFTKLLDGARGSPRLDNVDGVDERPEQWELDACKHRKLSGIIEKCSHLKLSPRQSS